jgi:tetratricopeptide (TPR) repeat protein
MNSPALKSNRKLAFAEGFRLRAEGDYERAVEPLRNALKQYPNYGPGWLCLGHALIEILRHPEAAECYRRAVELLPDDEIASIGLFHALIDIEDRQGATVEAKRYLERHRNGAPLEQVHVKAYEDWVGDADWMMEEIHRRKS